MSTIPLHHTSESSPETLVHCTPLITVLAAITPVLRRAHTVPLKVDFYTSFLCMRNISAWYGISRRDRV